MRNFPLRYLSENLSRVRSPFLLGTEGGSVVQRRSCGTGGLTACRLPFRKILAERPLGAVAKAWRVWVARLSASSRAVQYPLHRGRRVTTGPRENSIGSPLFAIRTLGATAHLFVFRKVDEEALLPRGFFYPHAKQTFRAFSYLDLLWCGGKLTVRDFPDKLLVM